MIYVEYSVQIAVMTLQLDQHVPACFQTYITLLHIATVMGHT